MKRFDVVLVLALLGASFFAGLQAWSLRKENKVGINKVVGKVSSLQGEAFRKGDADFFFVPAAGGGSVAENDHFTTGVKSEALIQLDAMQSQIILNEMSHIILKFQKDSFALDIRSGAVEALIAPGEIILVDGNRTLSAQGGPARVRYNKGLDEATFKVLEGKILVSDGTSQTIVTPLGADKVIVELQLKLPEDGAAVVSADKEVSFAWVTTKDLGPYTLKVFSEDRLVQNLKVTDTKATLRLPAVGNYTWTLQAEGLKETILPIKSFTLYDRALIEIEFPLAGKEFILAPEKTEQSVVFKWHQQIPGHSIFVVEKFSFANEPLSFVKENIQATVENNLKKDVPAGEFRWRIETDKGFSDWNSFEVKKEEIKPVKTPLVAKPVVKNKPKMLPPDPAPTPLSMPKAEPTPTIVAAPLEKKLEVEEAKTSWNGIEVPKIVSPDSGSNIITKENTVLVEVRAKSLSCNDYEMEIDTAKNFSNPTILKSENGTGRAQLKAATYFVRARCWKDGDMGDWSIVREFKIQKN